MLVVRTFLYKRVPLFKIFFFGILGLVAIAAIDRVRYEGFSDIGVDIFDSLFAKLHFLLDKRFDSYFPNLIYFFENTNIFDYRYGYDYLSVFLLLIPRSIFPEKPITFIREFNNTLELQSAGGTGGSAIIEAWINFGAFGILFNGILTALVLVLVKNQFNNALVSKNTSGFIFWYVWGTSLVHSLLISPGLNHGFVSLFLSGLFLLIYLKFFCKRIKF